VDNGFQGTQEEWLQSLVGPEGPKGDPGLSGGLDTGIVSGGDINPNESNPLAVDVSPLHGYIVDYLTSPVTITEISTSTVTTVELDSVSQTRAITWLLMDADGTVYQQAARPSPEDRRNFLVLGMVAQEGGTIFLTQSLATVVEQPVNQLYDLLDALGAFALTGNDITPVPGSLTLNCAPGQVFSRGWNHFDGTVQTNNPNIVSTIGATPASWVHVLRNSEIVPSAATATVDVGHYDNNGVLTPVGSTESVLHQLWMFPTSNGAEIHVLQYGQQTFGTLDDAIAGIGTASFALNPTLPGNAVLLGYLAAEAAATDLADKAQAKIVKAGKFGSGGGAGGGGGNVDLSEYAQLAGAEFTGAIGTRMAEADNLAQYSRVTTDTQDRFRRLSDGTQQWGDGSAPPDAELRRIATGVLAFLGTDLLVGQEDSKSFRLRQSGGALDLEGSGADLHLSVYELVNLAGTQRTYLRLEAATQLAHAVGKWVFSGTSSGAAVHTLDGEANQLGFHGATPVDQQEVVGDRSTGDALTSLLQALDAVGLISDTSTPGSPAVWTVNGEEGPDVTLDAANVGAIPEAEKGANGGVASLDAGGKVSASQLLFQATTPATRLPAWRPASWSQIFQTGHGWSASGSGIGSSNANDTAVFCKGTQSFRITTTGTGAVANIRRLASALPDLTGKAIRLVFRVSDVTHLNQINVILGSSTVANTFNWRLHTHAAIAENQVLSGEWVTMTLSWADVRSATGSYSISSTGAPSATSGFTDFMFQVVDDNTANPVTVHLQAVEFINDTTETFPEGVVSITFDDSYASPYTLGRPKMDTLGYRGTLYTIAENIGANQYLDLSQLKSVENLSGWEVAGHAYGSANHNAKYHTLTAEVVETDIRRMRAWMVNNGFRGDSFAYPGGWFSQTTDGVSIEGMTCRYFSSGRGISSADNLETFPPAMPLRMRSITGIGALAGASAKGLPANLIGAGGALDRCQLDGSWTILTFHEIVTGAVTTTNQCSQTDFNAIMDAIKARNIPVLPVGDVLRLYS
jgi:peptidoglycan/xylan/chitin deacetylase (PgdA/CDA1 family)